MDRCSFLLISLFVGVFISCSDEVAFEPPPVDEQFLGVFAGTANFTQQIFDGSNQPVAFEDTIIPLPVRLDFQDASNPSGNRIFARNLTSNAFKQVSIQSIADSCSNDFLELRTTFPNAALAPFWINFWDCPADSLANSSPFLLLDIALNVQLNEFNQLFSSTCITDSFSVLTSSTYLTSLPVSIIGFNENYSQIYILAYADNQNCTKRITGILEKEN